MFCDLVDRNLTILGAKKIDFKSRNLVFFLKGLVHDFSSNIIKFFPFLPDFW